MNDISCRVFRRNNKNIIVLWNMAQLDTSFVDPVIASLIDDDGKGILLTYSKFVPDSPEKFPKDIDGIVISHLNNNLDPNKAYKVKLLFVNGTVRHEVIKDVLPVAPITPSDVSKPVQVVHMYAYDYQNSKWVPLPLDQRVMLAQEE